MSFLTGSLDGLRLQFRELLERDTAREEELGVLRAMLVSNTGARESSNGGGLSPPSPGAAQSVHRRAYGASNEEGLSPTSSGAVAAVALSPATPSQCSTRTGTVDSSSAVAGVQVCENHTHTSTTNNNSCPVPTIIK